MKKVDNKNGIGNPFHDESDGTFTSPNNVNVSESNENQSDEDLFDELFGDDIEENEELENLFNSSNADSKFTMMTDEDIAILSGLIEPPPGGYFQVGAGGSYSINSALRKGDISDLSASNKRIINVMDRNMKPLDKDIDVIRFVGKGYLLSLGVDKNLIMNVLGGDEVSLARLRHTVFKQTISEKGFMSTTYNQNLDDSAFAGRFDRICRINLKCKKGNKVLFSPSKVESEMVLERGTKYVITNVQVKLQGNGKFGRPMKTIVFTAETI